MNETDTTYGIGPDKQFDELQALRDERDRLRAALGQATIALRYYAKTAISARAVEALEKMEKAQVFACFYCSQDHVWLASQDGWHATKKEGVKVRCEAKAALTPAAKGGDDEQSEITQRTAELEAANEKVQFLEKKNSNLLDSSNTVLKVKADQDVRLADLQAELERVRGELAKMRERKDGAYLERNRVVAALASCFPSGISRTAIEGWHDDWHGCVYIDLPTGQVSWHYHDSHAHLFAHLPPYTKQWDGHTTEEKYERVALLQHRQGME